MTETTLTRHDLEAKIVKRCWQDETFQQQFTADPVATAVEYLQVPAEQVPNIVVHEEAAGSWHIVIPVKPARTSELSDQDLEAVAGGATPATSFILVSVGAVTSIASGSVTASVGLTLDQGW